MIDHFKKFQFFSSNICWEESSKGGGGGGRQLQILLRLKGFVDTPTIHNLHLNILSLIEMRSILRFLYYVLSTCYFLFTFHFKYIDCTNSLPRFNLNLGGEGGGVTWQ